MLNLKINGMKNLKILMILLTVIVSNEMLAQQQSIIIIQMHAFPTKADPIQHQGGGVSPLETLPFIIKVIDENNELSENIFDQHNRKNPIETLPLLKKEINDWILKGYNLFSFNAVDGGLNTYKYTVVMIKE